MYLQYVHLDSGPRGAYHVRGWIGHFRYFGFWVRWGWGEAQHILCPTSWWRIQQMFTNSSGLRCKNMYIHVNCWATSIISCFQDRFEVTDRQVTQPVFSPRGVPWRVSLPTSAGSCQRPESYKLHSQICTISADWGTPICTPRTMQTGKRCQPFEETFSRVACRLSGILSFHAFHTLIAHYSHQNEHTACFNRAWSQN